MKKNKLGIQNNWNGRMESGFMFAFLVTILFGLIGCTSSPVWIGVGPS